MILLSGLILLNTLLFIAYVFDWRNLERKVILECLKELAFVVWFMCSFSGIVGLLIWGTVKAIKF